MTSVAVGVGGAAGAAARYLVAAAFAAAGAASFPWTTLVVNILGSFLLGVLAAALPRHTPPSAARAGLTVGFCGGFTTFSAFALDAVMLSRAGQTWHAGAYIASTLLLGLLAMTAGLNAGDGIVTARLSRGGEGR